MKLFITCMCGFNYPSTFNHPVTSMIFMYIYVMVDCVADQWDGFKWFVWGDVGVCGVGVWVGGCWCVVCGGGVCGCAFALLILPRTFIWKHHRYTEDSTPSEDPKTGPRKTLAKNAENVMFYHLRGVRAPRTSMDFQPYLIYEDIRVLGSISKASRGVCAIWVSEWMLLKVCWVWWIWV